MGLRQGSKHDKKTYYRDLLVPCMLAALELTAAYDDLEHTGVAAIAGATRCVLAL